MRLKFECRWCGKERCDARGELCSLKCEEAEKKLKIDEVEGELDGDRWRACCADDTLEFMLARATPQS
jgi:hypothetical protein